MRSDIVTHVGLVLTLPSPSIGARLVACKVCDGTIQAMVKTDSRIADSIQYQSEQQVYSCYLCIWHVTLKMHQVVNDPKV